jgi:Tfp pilus assembly protein FimT
VHNINTLPEYKCVFFIFVQVKKMNSLSIQRNTLKQSFAGFTIAELLIALFITALLLAAVAVAFNASLMNYNTNEDIFSATNKARQALTQMIPQIRTADSVTNDSLPNECELNSGAVKYSYNSSEQKLYMIKGGTYLLCDNVKDMSFTKIVSGGVVKSVIISMTVGSGQTSQKFSTAVVVRKKL